jgi:hypothetical protein
LFLAKIVINALLGAEELEDPLTVVLFPLMETVEEDDRECPMNPVTPFILIDGVGLESDLEKARKAPPPLDIVSSKSYGVITDPIIELVECTYNVLYTDK